MSTLALLPIVETNTVRDVRYPEGSLEMSERQQVPGPVLTRRRAVGLTLGASMAMSPLAMRAHLASPQPRAGVLAAHMSPAGSPDSPAGSVEYAHPGALVSSGWVRDRLDDPVLVLVGFMPAEEFDVAHIPGSVQLDWPELEVIDTSDASIESWHQDVQQLLGNLGITPDNTVVVYDNGTLLSARLWWILHYLGHEDVHILNGGFPDWQQVVQEVEAGAVEAPASGEPYAGTPNAELLAQREEVLARLEDPGVVILDARTPEEYTEGRIPGAMNLNFPLNAAPEAPKFFRGADELRAMYDGIGATADKLVIPYCASGVRSAVTAFVLHLLGYENVALYTGSWLEWGEHPDTPKETGVSGVARPLVSSPYVL